MTYNLCFLYFMLHLKLKFCIKIKKKQKKITFKSHFFCYEKISSSLGQNKLYEKYILGNTCYCLSQIICFVYDRK